MNTLPQRYQDKIMPEPMSGCWLWIGGRSPQGYGSVGGRELAHRAVYEILKQKIPEGKVIDHLCRNRCCVNPQHLECVSMAVNTERGNLFVVKAAKAASRTHCNKGHIFSSDNVYHGKKGRYCKICQYEGVLRYRQTKSAKRSA